ncbi:MAG TPA: hypothetical protein VIV60_29185 [Polyangiaceae bacterium]
MRTRFRMVSLLLTVGACGGRVGGSDQADAAGAGSASSAQSEGGADTRGANEGGSAAVGGTLGVSCTNAPVYFVVLPPSNASALWCMGKPRGCQYVPGSIGDASGYLNLRNLCSTDCESCKQTDCHSLLCLGPSALPASGITGSWNGSYYRESTCGGLATRCSAKVCAVPGRYSTEACGFVNPNPPGNDGCREAPESTPVHCVQVVFDYPTDDTVVIRMPDTA